MAEHEDDLQRCAAILVRMCYLGGMPFAHRRVTTKVLAVIFCASTAIPGAYAQPTEGRASDSRDAARRSFEKGEQAYEAHDYVLAAQAFDEAFRIAPHYAPLWNAARSWERAGESARAANAYAKYLRLAPSDAPDRDAATKALATLAEKLGRIELHAPGMNVVRVNDEVLDGTSVYVHPGMHVIEGQTSDRTIRRTEMIEAGSVRSVALVEVKPEEPVATPLMVPTPVPIASVSSHAPKVQPVRLTPTPQRFGPAAIVAGGLTVVSSSLLVWSGIDTLSARAAFDAAPTTDKLEAGHDKQLRTNILIGTTITAGLATGVLLSLWKWDGPTMRAAVKIAPPVLGSPLHIGVTGSF